MIAPFVTPSPARGACELRIDHARWCSPNRDDNGLDQYYVSYVVVSMQSVCETHAFRRAAEQAGMTEHEIARLVDHLAKNSMAGDEMAGTGGCRKVRVGGRGKGKRGEARRKSADLLEAS